MRVRKGKMNLKPRGTSLEIEETGYAWVASPSRRFLWYRNWASGEICLFPLSVNCAYKSAEGYRLYVKSVLYCMNLSACFSHPIFHIVVFRLSNLPLFHLQVVKVRHTWVLASITLSSLTDNSLWIETHPSCCGGYSSCICRALESVTWPSATAYATVESTHCHFSRGKGTVCLVQHPNVSLVQVHPFQLMGTGGKPLHPQPHHGPLLLPAIQVPRPDRGWHTLAERNGCQPSDGWKISFSIWAVPLSACGCVVHSAVVGSVCMRVESSYSRAARLVMQQRQCHSALGLKAYQSGQMDNRLPCGCTSAPEKAHHIWLTVTGPDSFGQGCK